MAEVIVQVAKNGPLIVKGSVTLQDAVGGLLPSTEPTVALCRCGHSQKKPFCDGSHKAAGFQG